LTTLITFYWFNEINGKILRVHLFLNNRQFQIISNKCLIRFVNIMLRLVVYVVVFMPLLCLGVWGAALIRDVKMD
jgi:hypothetical protein